MVLCEYRQSVSRATCCKCVSNDLVGIDTGRFDYLYAWFLTKFIRDRFLLAFLRGMIGALIAEIFYRYFNRSYMVASGEIDGTCLIGAFFISSSR